MTWSSHFSSGFLPAMSMGRVMFSAAFSVGMQVERLEHEADPVPAQPGQLALLEPGDLRVAEPHLAGGDGVEPRQAVHQRGLPGARRPHHRGEPAARDVHVDRVEGEHGRLARAVRLGQAAGPGGAIPRGRRRPGACSAAGVDKAASRGGCPDSAS